MNTRNDTTKSSFSLRNFLSIFTLSKKARTSEKVRKALSYYLYVVSSLYLIA